MPAPLPLPTMAIRPVYLNQAFHDLGRDRFGLRLVAAIAARLLILIFLRLLLCLLDALQNKTSRLAGGPSPVV
ncbi:MAG: hypothetical protein DRN21_06025 [Thermoplasmata archaeon]|nr:MAG: hypothetical protein DRN21_06025 [Thermoplasmata archaeon]